MTGCSILRLAGVMCLCYLASATVTFDDEFLAPGIRKKRDLSSKIDGRLKVVTIKHAPYTMQEDGKKPYGFIPDLMWKLSRRLRFQYDFVFSAKYGTLNETTNTWDGMIGEIVKNENNSNDGAHIAAAAITVTAAREEYVDFVKPFQSLGLSIVIKKPYWDIKRMVFQASAYGSPFDFSILSPLAPEVWGLVILCVFAVALALWVTNKFNPYEWEGRLNLGLAERDQAELFNLSGSLWFVFTTLQWQGFERAPRSIGARVLTVFWFIFVTITLVTYTAGIVSNLYWASMAHNQDPLRHNIHNLEDLVNDPTYNWGTIRGGSTETYLRKVAVGPEYTQMLSYMNSEAGQQNMVNSIEDGLKKVREGQYAFIMESASAQYNVNKAPCDIMVVGVPFATRSYGMAVANNSPILEDLHRAVLEMIEEGEILALEKKWFVDQAGECWNISRMENFMTKTKRVDLNQPKKVNLSMFWAPLVFLIAGIILSALSSIGETLWYKFRGRYQAANRPQGQVLKLENDDV